MSYDSREEEMYSNIYLTMDASSVFCCYKRIPLVAPELLVKASESRREVDTGVLEACVQGEDKSGANFSL